MAKRTPTAAPNDAPVPPERLSYERAMEEVEAIADRIESGEAGLDESVRAYERGMALIKHCRMLLERAEQRVLELNADAPPGGGGSIGDATGRGGGASGTGDPDDDEDVNG